MKRILFAVIVSALSMGAVQAQDTDRIPSKGFAVDSAEGHFHPYEFTRHAIGDNDILIETVYAALPQQTPCGVG